MFPSTSQQAGVHPHTSSHRRNPNHPCHLDSVAKISLDISSHPLPSGNKLHHNPPHLTHTLSQPHPPPSLLPGMPQGPGSNAKAYGRVPPLPPFPQLMHIKDSPPRSRSFSGEPVDDEGAASGEDDEIEDAASSKDAKKEKKPHATRRRVVQSCSECRRR